MFRAVNLRHLRERWFAHARRGTPLLKRPLTNEASGEFAALHKRLDDAAKESAELRVQVSQLLLHSRMLTSQMESLKKEIKAYSNQNLIDIQQFHGVDVSNRVEFRPSKYAVRNQPTHVSQIGSRPLFELAVKGVHAAHKERLLREIMNVDGVTWDQAQDKLFEMDVYNEKYYWIETFPYRVGITIAVISAVAGTAMVFYPPVAEHYGVTVAGEELPEGVGDISNMTINQVGTWTWGWMEPMIGTASFVILCSQFARAQMWKLHMRPYTEAMLRERAQRLMKKYPQYESGIVRDWAKHMPFADSMMFPTYRRFLGFRRL